MVPSKEVLIQVLRKLNLDFFEQKNNLDRKESTIFARPVTFFYPDSSQVKSMFLNSISM